MLGTDRVVVPIRGDHQIRVFTLGGELVAEYGRSGAGPGEFTSLSAAWARADTIEALDSRLMRLSRFHDGRLLETIRLRGAGVPVAGRPGLLGDGWAFTGIVDAAPNRRDEMAVFYFDRQGSGVQLSVTAPGFLRYRSPVMVDAVPLSPRAQVLSDGNRLYIGETLTPSISVFDASGTLQRRLQWNPDPGPTVSDAAARVLALAVDQAPVHRRAFVKAHLTNAPEPQGLPVFSSFLVDDMGFVWVRPYQVERDAKALGGPLATGVIGAGGRWTVYAPDGNPIGDIDIPEALELHYIGLNAVVGIRRDRLGMEYVQVHRLQRRAVDPD